MSVLKLLLKQLFVYSGYKGIVDLLFKNNTDVNVKIKDNETALIETSSKGIILCLKSKIDKYSVRRRYNYFFSLLEHTRIPMKSKESN